MTINGDVVLKCPKTGEEVRLYRDCIKLHEPQNCPYYQHFGIEGRKIVIACSYEVGENANKT